MNIEVQGILLFYAMFVWAVWLLTLMLCALADIMTPRNWSILVCLTPFIPPALPFAILGVVIVGLIWDEWLPDHF